ncbi:TonB-dependent receptor family protein [Salinisphaera orenii]|nr:TonB-dependent receptor plug domain-containing protein [Salinisphaera halophila]
MQRTTTVRSRNWGAVSVMACSGLMFEAVPVFAEERKRGMLAPINVEETVPTDITETPGAAATLYDDELEEKQPYTLMDGLDYAAGVRTVYDDVLGRRSGIAVRGAPTRRSRKTLLLEDGVPINGSTYIDPSAHYTPPVERLERVDVLKGAGHVLHGPLNNHGIVNFRNKQPTETPETTIKLGAGGQGTFKRHIMHTRTDGPVGTVFAYTGMNADGSFDVEDFQYDDFFASADWAINDRHDLGFSFVYFRERSHYDESNLLPAEYDRSPRSKRGRFAQRYNNISVNYFKYDLTHDWRPTDRLSISTRLFHTDLERPRFTVEPDEVDVVDGSPDFSRDGYEDPAFFFERGASGVMIGRDRTYKTHGAESRFQLTDLEALGAEHTLQWGVRYEWHEFSDREPVGGTGELLDESNRGRAGIGVFEPTTGEGSSLTEYDADAISGFVQNAIRIGDVTLTPGVRVERYTQEREVIFEDSEPGSPREKDDNTLVLPSISLLYEGFEETQLFANVGRGYTPAFARTAEDFPLEPETGVNSQFGFRTTAIRGTRLEGAVFYNRIQDTVVQEPITIDGDNLVVNAADSYSYGLDLSARIDSRAFHLDSDYNVFGELAYNYTRAEFTSGDLDGNDVPQVPNHVGTFTLGLEHRTGWRVSASLHYLDSFFAGSGNAPTLTVADEDGNPIDPDNLARPTGSVEIREPAVLGEIPDHTLLSARASYDLPDTGFADTTVWIQGRNLTDKQFITDYVNGIRPGPERTVVVGFTSRF